MKIPHARFKTDTKRFSFTLWRKKTDSVNKLEGGIIRKLWAKCEREQNPLKVNKNTQGNFSIKSPSHRLLEDQRFFGFAFYLVQACLVKQNKDVMRILHNRGKVANISTFFCLQINQMLNKNNSFLIHMKAYHWLFFILEQKKKKKMVH